jgi:hypothetical protein
MKRGPAAGRRSKTDFAAKAVAAWGDALPDWVAELARYASETSGTLAADAIGYSPAVVTHVIGNAYKGDLARVEDKVRGALMGMVVACPVLGEIGRNRCLDEQKTPFSASSSIRSKLYRACRSGCPHSRILGGAS